MHPSEILVSEPLRLMSLADYERLAELGAFEDEQVELLEGVIVEMSPQGNRHAGVIMELNEVLVPALLGRARVRVQLPLTVGKRSRPEPDVAVVPPGRYLDAHPAQAYLVIEVAETSLRKDRLLKPRIYAAAGVPECWVIDVNDNTVLRMTGPVGELYTHVETLGRADRVSLAVFPDVVVSLAEILPE